VLGSVASTDELKAAASAVHAGVPAVELGKMKKQSGLRRSLTLPFTVLADMQSLERTAVLTLAYAVVYLGIVVGVFGVWTPITLACGPVMPASVIAAVPPGSTRASFVWTCVCVPITAVTRPSSHRAIATFSLVASAWKSSTTTAAFARALSSTAHRRPPR
jgi:hypothetical protein